MEIGFDTKKLRSICESNLDAQRKLGNEVAEVLQRRLADLRAATNIGDLVANPPTEVDGEVPEHLGIDLPSGYQIIFSANHPKKPITESGILDWSRVNRVRILDIRRREDRE